MKELEALCYVTKKELFYFIKTEKGSN